MSEVDELLAEARRVFEVLDGISPDDASCGMSLTAAVEFLLCDGLDDAGACGN